MPFKYSKTLINNAGDTLSKRNDCMDESTAWEVLDYWRSMHQVPLHYISMNLARHAERIDRNALIARRLKRSPSIFSKLLREKDLTLRKMQDIGGCRAIVANVDLVTRLANSFRGSTQKHQFERVKDYISNPKPSGYRGIHLIYRFQSDDEKNSEYNGLRIEIQIRSKKQHLWATAVEIVGSITKQSLKSSKGGSDWYRFFQRMSEAIALEENGKVADSVLLNEIVRLEEK